MKYFGGFEPGTPVMVREPSPIKGRTGVVAFMNDSILAVIQPGEVPVRVVLSQRKGVDDETAVYLLKPEQIERVHDAVTTNKPSRRRV